MQLCSIFNFFKHRGRLKRVRLKQLDWNISLSGTRNRCRDVDKINK